MKKWKKAGAAALSLAMVTGVLAGAPAVSSAADTKAADVQAIIDRGVLRVGVKNAVIGFGYQDPLTEEYSGMEIELAEKLAEKLGVDGWLPLPSRMREKRTGTLPLRITRTM